MSKGQIPLVTIMIPTFNQAKVLPRAIESALKQTYTNLEILISDDNSSDNTTSVIEQFLQDPRVRYIRHSQSLGRVGNYHKMIYELAKGEWLLNVDGDDFLVDSKFIEKAMNIVINDPTLVLVFGRQKYLDASTNTETIHPAPELPSKLSGLELFLHYPSIPEGMPHIGSIYRKDSAIQSGVQNEDIITSDSESLLRIIVNGRVAYIDCIAGCWVGHSSNESGQLSFEKRWSSLRMAIGPAEYVHSLKILPKAKIESWKYRMLARLIRENLCLYLDRKDKQGFVRFWTEAVKHYPQAALRASFAKSVLLRLFIPGFSKLKMEIKKFLRS